MYICVSVCTEDIPNAEIKNCSNVLLPIKFLGLSVCLWEDLLTAPTFWVAKVHYVHTLHYMFPTTIINSESKLNTNPHFL